MGLKNYVHEYKGPQYSYVYEYKGPPVLLCQMCFSVDVYFIMTQLLTPGPQLLAGFDLARGFLLEGAVNRRIVNSPETLCHYETKFRSNLQLVQIVWDGGC